MFSISCIIETNKRLIVHQNAVTANVTDRSNRFLHSPRWSRHPKASLLASRAPPPVNLAPNRNFRLLVQLELSEKATSITPMPSLSVTDKSPVSNGGFLSRCLRIFRLNPSTVQLSSLKSAFSGTISTLEVESGPETTRAFVAASTSSIATGEPSSASILDPVNMEDCGEFTNRSLSRGREGCVSESDRSFGAHDQERQG